MSKRNAPLKGELPVQQIYRLNADFVRTKDKPGTRKLNATDRINFGKHKGKTIGNLLVTAPQYLRWAYCKIEWFNLSDSAYKDMILLSSLADDEHADALNAWAWGVATYPKYVNGRRIQRSTYDGRLDDQSECL